MDVPKIKPDNFDGRLGHIMDSGNNQSTFFLYVIPETSVETRKKIDKLFSSNAGKLQSITDTDMLQNGRIYVVCVEGQYERAWFLKLGAEDNHLIHMVLMDKGLEKQITRNEVLKCPKEASGIDVFGVMCPVLISNANEEIRLVAQKLTGRKCRCIADQVINETSAIPYLKGRILIEYESGGYAELKDIALKPIEGKDCAKFVIECGYAQRNAFSFWNAVASDNNQIPRNNSFPRQSFIDKNQHKEGGGGAFRVGPRRNNNSTPAFQSTYNRLGPLEAHQYAPACADGFEDCDIDENQIPELISKSIFREYEPKDLPKSSRVRYVRQFNEASPNDQFWMVNPSIFTTIERVLYGRRNIYSELPSMENVRLEEMVGKGCLVRVSVDDGSRCLCRAIICKYSTRLRRASAYLVDFGIFKWAKGVDVIDISTLNGKDGVFKIWIAMFRCCIDPTAPTRIEDLIKGSEYVITIIARRADGVFVVKISSVGEALSSTSLNQSDIMQDMVSNVNDLVSTSQWNDDPIMRKLTNSFPTMSSSSVDLMNDYSKHNNNQSSNITTNTAINNAFNNASNISTNAHSTISNNFLPFIGSQLGYGMPYIIPVAVPVPVPSVLNGRSPFNAMGSAMDSQQIAMNNSGSSTSFPIGNEQQDRKGFSGDNNAVFNKSNWQSRNDRFSGNYQVSSDNKSGRYQRQRGRAFGGRRNERGGGGGGRREGGYGDGFESRGSFDFDDEPRRGETFWKTDDEDIQQMDRKAERQFRKEQGDSASASNFKTFSRSNKPSFLKNITNKQSNTVSSEWDLPPSRQAALNAAYATTASNTQENKDQQEATESSSK